MPKLGSINYQLITKMKSITHFGESKHQSKMQNIQEARSTGTKINSTKVEGIYSYNTFEAYKQTSKEFGAWMKENHPTTKNINNISNFQVCQYLKSRENSGCSAWTIDKDKSALNKVLDKNITKKEAGLKPRKLSNISRSRNSGVSNDAKFNPKNYVDQITVAKNTGIRRQSMLNICPNDFDRNEDGQCIALNVKEKGGRKRKIPILASGQVAVTDIVNKAKNKDLMGDDKLFDKYSKMVDNHSFRSEYANSLYNQLQVSNNNPLDYKGTYSKENLRAVSNALGHNRIGVVVDHYLRT